MNTKQFNLIVTLDELNLIAQALGTAEKSYSDIRKSLVDLASVRGMSAQAKEHALQRSNVYWDEACRYADLCIRFRNILEKVDQQPAPEYKLLQECAFCKKVGPWRSYFSNLRYWCGTCELPEGTEYDMYRNQIAEKE